MFNTLAVLPRFEVTLEGPKQLTQEELFITGRVVAEYVWGLYVHVFEYIHVLGVFYILRVRNQKLHFHHFHAGTHLVRGLTEQ